MNVIPPQSMPYHVVQLTNAVNPPLGSQAMRVE